MTAGTRRVALTAAELGAIGAGRFVRIDLGAPLRMPDGGVTRSALVGRPGGGRVPHRGAPADVPAISSPQPGR